MKTMARRSGKVAVPVFSALGSSMGVVSLRRLRKGQGRGELPRG